MAHVSLAASILRPIASSAWAANSSLCATFDYIRASRWAKAAPVSLVVLDVPVRNQRNCGVAIGACGPAHHQSFGEFQTMTLDAQFRFFNPSAAACAVAVVLALSGCATKPVEPNIAPAPQEQPLAQYMADAAKARTDRMTVKERDTYRAAARVYPTAKDPWLKLAESYFEDADYGNAILASQEVLQRDASDQLASGVLVVSGLRVSTQALQSLRTQNNNLQADTRSQAEGLTRMLRETLGGVELVPQQPAATQPRPAGASGGAGTAPNPVARTPRTPAGTGPAPASATGATRAPAAPRSGQGAAPGAAASAPAKNPFDALK